MTYKSIIAENTKQILKERGLKQCAFAERIGYNSRAFSNMLCGRRVITADDVLIIARELDVDPNFLFGIHKEKE